MKLIVGLGNPGPKYELTRHNAGFLVLDQLADRHKVSVKTEKYHGLVGSGNMLGESCYFLKPMTFMNLSGRSVVGLAHFYKIPPQDIIVLYDDVDVPPGKVKGRNGGGHGGHNGVRSIMQELGSADFHRIKLGVGKPGPDSPVGTADWVLGRFTDEELKVLETTMMAEVELRLRQIFLQK